MHIRKQALSDFVWRYECACRCPKPSQWRLKQPLSRNFIYCGCNRKEMVHGTLKPAKTCGDMLPLILWASQGSWCPASCTRVRRELFGSFFKMRTIAATTKRQKCRSSKLEIICGCWAQKNRQSCLECAGVCWFSWGLAVKIARALRLAWASKMNT